VTAVAVGFSKIGQSFPKAPVNRNEGNYANRFGKSSNSTLSGLSRAMMLFLVSSGLSLIFGL